jgi:hypothetical protein
MMKDPGTEPKTDTDGDVLADCITEKPTDSHTRAVEAPVVEGGNPVGYGWNKDDPHDVARLVDGLNNEDFWVLVRRFNKVCGLSPSTLYTCFCPC